MNSNEYFTDSEKVVNKLEKLVKEPNPGFLFDGCRVDGSNIIQVNEKQAPDPKKHDVWFLGDIHGDLLGMTAALKYAETQSSEHGREPWFIFLGDFTDRGPFDYLVLLKLYAMAVDDEQRSRMCVIVGNHDECLEYSEERKEFFATVEPAEFTDWLNNKKDDDLWQHLGHATISFFKKMPRAVFLPDGLVIAHAGVPHTDRHDDFEEPGFLGEDVESLQDFVWSRAHERAPKRRPNRTSKGHSFGRKDFTAFCNRATEKLGQPVKRMIRGHDHFIEGFRYYEKYEQNQMLTLNTRCIQPDMIDGPYSDKLCVALWQKDQIPQVHILEVPKSKLQETVSSGV